MNYTCLIKPYFLLIFLCIGCKEVEQKKGMTKAELSTIICNCASPVAQFNVELKALTQASDMAALSQKMSNGDRIMTIAIDCVIDKIDEKTKSLVDDELSKLIADQCKLDARMTADFFEKIENHEFPFY